MEERELLAISSLASAPNVHLSKDCGSSLLENRRTISCLWSLDGNSVPLGQIWDQAGGSNTDLIIGIKQI